MLRSRIIFASFSPLWYAKIRTTVDSYKNVSYLGKRARLAAAPLYASFIRPCARSLPPRAGHPARLRAVGRDKCRLPRGGAVQRVLSEMPKSKSGVDSRAWPVSAGPPKFAQNAEIHQRGDFAGARGLLTQYD